MRTSKPCSQCGETKDLRDFPSNKGKADGKRSSCRVCTNAAEREGERRKRRQAGIPVKRFAKASTDSSS